MTKRCENLLIGLDEITGYLGVSEPLFYKLKKMFEKAKVPFPIVRINGRWFAHKGNLDEHMRLITKKPAEIDP